MKIPKMRNYFIIWRIYLNATKSVITILHFNIFQYHLNRSRDLPYCKQQDESI